ncbi:TPA: acyl-CoA thioesterase [Klebsiella pneumoniae]|uniref:acyl-CoA thioesterase n=1 Tax=Klebsiella quasipneumoniae TaxID=1463165 RepID=UPI001E64A3CD|nr:acyl-CoA thioesterase [Klebsiella quasipneumoniae]MCD7091371.1 acyl-CoA thioesterase [Klebsiella quasipneumoniae subsp. quasipneumoniae]HBW6183534.1 acyl-CoA thioesterase [Klebsiella pneumoniae]HEC2117198.1 acyl-CoA thioesterase [Klebsiella oxytoca]
MFIKKFAVDEKHVDFQGVVDGLYYPFYMEWTRHAYMKDELGLDLEAEFKEGRLHMILEYSMKFRKSLLKDHNMEVTCQLQKNEKRNRVNFVQQILVDGVVFAEATFVATCLVNGRPSVPDVVQNAIVE